MKASGGLIAHKVVAVDSLDEQSRWITLAGSMDASPGQFVMVWLPGMGEKPFSIASTRPLSLLVIDVGEFSHKLCQINAGDQVFIKGPLGNGFINLGEDNLLVGGGYGVAPLLLLAQTLRKEGQAVSVCLGARSTDRILLSEEFESLGCQVSIATEDVSLGSAGLITDVVEEILLRAQFDCLYACGPVGMLSVLANICSRYKLDYQLSWEAHMRCGMGLCGSCEVSKNYDPQLPPGWLACYDGPVFCKRW